MLGYTRIGRVSIGDRVFVGGNALILPGVRIGSDSIIGAGSVVTSDVAPGQVCVGNPARVVASTSDYLKKRREQLARDPCFNREYTVGGQVTKAMKREMFERLAERFGFVE